MSSASGPRLFPVLMVNFIGTLGFSIVLPFLVFLVEDFGGNAVVYGLVGATYPLFQLVGAPILGRWSDSMGRKRVLFLSQAGTLLSWVIFVGALFVPETELARVESDLFGDFTLTLPLLVVFIARALDGLTGGNVSVANAYVADITTEDERSAAYGRMGVSANLGFIIGPGLASVLGATPFEELLPVLAALLISLVATVLIGVWLPESKPCVMTRTEHGKSVHKVFGQEHRDCVRLSKPGEHADSTWTVVLKRPHVSLMLVLYFVIFLGFNFFYTGFPVHAVVALEWSVTETGIFFGVLSGLMVVVQGPVLSWVSKRLSPPLLVVVGNAILGGNFLLLLNSDYTSIYAAAALFALGNGIMWPSVLSLLSKVAGEVLQGTVQGMASGIGSFASILGLVVGGVMYEQLGAYTFVACAALIWVAALASLPLLRIRDPRPATT